MEYAHERRVEGLTYKIAFVAVIIFIIELTLLGGSGLFSFGTLVICIIFAAKQLSENFQYGVVLLSVVIHFVLAVSPDLAFAHRGFNDGGFGQFLSALNLAVLVPWAINLTIIRSTEGTAQKTAKVLGSLGNASISIVLAVLYMVVLYENLTYWQSETSTVLVGLSIKTCLLGIEFILFVWLACCGE